MVFLESYAAVWDAHTAEMSEEVKEKATGKSAHRKKKGKKVKQFAKPGINIMVWLKKKTLSDSERTCERLIYELQLNWIFSKNI